MGSAAHEASLSKRGLRPFTPHQLSDRAVVGGASLWSADTESDCGTITTAGTRLSAIGGADAPARLDLAAEMDDALTGRNLRDEYARSILMSSYLFLSLLLLLLSCVRIGGRCVACRCIPSFKTQLCQCVLCKQSYCRSCSAVCITVSAAGATSRERLCRACNLSPVHLREMRHSGRRPLSPSPLQRQRSPLAAATTKRRSASISRDAENISHTTQGQFLFTCSACAAPSCTGCQVITNAVAVVTALHRTVRTAQRGTTP